MEGHRPRCPRVRTFRACDVTGSNEGTEAGAPPMTSRVHMFDVFDIAKRKRSLRPVTSQWPTAEKRIGRADSYGVRILSERVLVEGTDIYGKDCCYGRRRVHRISHR